MKLKLKSAFDIFFAKSNGKFWPQDIEKMRELEQHGFVFQLERRAHHTSYYVCENPLIVEVNTIDDLIALMDKFDCPIILQRDYDTGEPELMLYNDYIE